VSNDRWNNANILFFIIGQICCYIIVGRPFSLGPFYSFVVKICFSTSFIDRCKKGVGLLDGRRFLSSIILDNGGKNVFRSSMVYLFVLRVVVLSALYNGRILSNAVYLLGLRYFVVYQMLMLLVRKSC